MLNESITTSLYDHVTLTSKETYLFQQPVGIGGKLREHTNMVWAGKLITPQTFLIKEIGLISDSFATFTLIIAGRVYAEHMSYGTRFIPVEPLLIDRDVSFSWMVVSDFFPQKVSVSMLGTLTRPGPVF